MLIPSRLSATSQKKYFDKVIEHDYNPMYKDGLINSLGETIRVQIFAQVLDLKGKEKFLNQVSVQSYVGCSHCTAHFDKGCRGPRFAMARRYLPSVHRLRNRIVSSRLQYPTRETAGMRMPWLQPLILACSLVSSLTVSTTDHSYILLGAPKLKTTIFVHTAVKHLLLQQPAQNSHSHSHTFILTRTHIHTNTLTHGPLFRLAEHWKDTTSTI